MNEETKQLLENTEVLVNQQRINIADIFNIDENNLSDEFASQASVFAYFSVMLADAERDVSLASAKKDEEYAAADEFVRKQFNERGEKFTEAVVKAAVLQDEECIGANNVEIVAKHQYRSIRAIVDALAQRANMLVSLGAHKRHEWEMTGMNIQDKKAQEALGNVKEIIKKRRDSVKAQV